MKKMLIFLFLAFFVANIDASEDYRPHQDPEFNTLMEIRRSQAENDNTIKQYELDARIRRLEQERYQDDIKTVPSYIQDFQDRYK